MHFQRGIFYLLLSTFSAQRSIAFQKITGPQNAPNVTMAQTLLVNAIVGKENVSTVECWAIQPGYQISPQVRTYLCGYTLQSRVGLRFESLEFTLFLLDGNDRGPDSTARKLGQRFVYCFSK